MFYAYFLAIVLVTYLGLTLYCLHWRFKNMFLKSAIFLYVLEMYVNFGGFKVEKAQNNF